MSTEAPTPDELKAATRLLRGSREFGMVLTHLQRRYAEHMTKLLQPDEAGQFRFIQGRANELGELLKFFQES